jgi:hypothetical protein
MISTIQIMAENFDSVLGPISARRVFLSGVSHIWKGEKMLEKRKERGSSDERVKSLLRVSFPRPAAEDIGRW